MGIKLGDISPLAGAITGKGMFGKGLAKLADSGAGMLVPMSYLAKSQRDKNARRAAMEIEMQKKGAGMRGRPMVEDVMVAEQVPAMKKGGKVKKMAKGGSTASKRADGCATKGKTKGRFV
jgi:hypothetical protein